MKSPTFFDDLGIPTFTLGIIIVNLENLFQPEPVQPVVAEVKPIIDKLFFFQAGFIQRVGKHIMHRAPFIAEILRKFQIAHFFGAAKQIPLAFGFFAGEQ